MIDFRDRTNDHFKAMKLESHHIDWYIDKKGKYKEGKTVGLYRHEHLCHHLKFDKISKVSIKRQMSIELRLIMHLLHYENLDKFSISHKILYKFKNNIYVYHYDFTSFADTEIIDLVDDISKILWVYKWDLTATDQPIWQLYHYDKEKRVYQI